MGTAADYSWHPLRFEIDDKLTIPGQTFKRPAFSLPRQHQFTLDASFIERLAVRTGLGHRPAEAPTYLTGIAADAGWVLFEP
jgi:hypothetical protein